MTFFAGLIIGVFSGALSWIAAAAWLEFKRTEYQQRARGGDATSAGITGLRQQHSNA